MGSSFNNISVLRNDIEEEQIKKHIIQYMRKMGFTPAEDNADSARTVMIRNNPNSKWFTIYDDESDEEQEKQLSKSIAKTLKTYAMYISNCDSDFIIIDLYGQTESDMVIIGNPYDMSEEEIKKAQGRHEIWQDLAKDTRKLLDAFKEDFLFSEEVLEVMDEEIGTKYEDINIDISEISEEELDILTLRFKQDSIQNMPTTENHPSFECIEWHYLEPDEVNSSLFINRGSKSKGITVIISGYLVDHNSISIDEITLSQYKYPINNILNANEKTIEKKVTVCMDSVGSRKAIYASFPNFTIPDGFECVYEGEKPTEVLSIEKRFSLCVEFVPKGEWQAEQETDLYVKIQPLSSEIGSATAHTWKQT